MPGRGALRAAAVLFLAPAAAGCAGGEQPPRAHAVEIAAFVYRPAGLAVAPGDTVVFTNRDPVPHTATAADGSWDSGSLAKDASWRLVVPEGGIGAYRCAFHPNMAASLARAE